MCLFENRRVLSRCGDLGGETENNIAFLFCLLILSRSQKNKQLIEFFSNVWMEEQGASN